MKGAAPEVEGGFRQIRRFFSAEAFHAAPGRGSGENKPRIRRNLDNRMNGGVVVVVVVLRRPQAEPRPAHPPESWEPDAKRGGVGGGA
jgi:hypothetical protein